MSTSLTPMASVIAAYPQALWSAAQMARYQGAVLATGFTSLNAELPNGGWPCGVLIELLLQQAGIGEIQLLLPALMHATSTRRVVMIQPPHAPQVGCWSSWGLPAERLLWIRPSRSGDALWAAEQILRNGSCGAVLLWQTNVRPESLRRLHLAAQASDTLFWMLRPLSAKEDASPSPLRLALRPASAGIVIDIVKRRGPQALQSQYLKLETMPAGSFSVPSSAPSMTPSVTPSFVPSAVSSAPTSPLHLASQHHARMDLRTFATPAP